MRAVAALALLVLVLAGPAGAQRSDPDSAARRVRRTGATASRADSAPAHRYFFAHPERDYGSDAIRSPVDVWMNRGLSIIVFDDEERALGRMHWAAGWAAVRDAFTHPRRAVQRAGGMEKVFNEEVLPNGGQVWSWAWAPNYGGHLIAGGITYRFLGEWFDDRGVPAPKLMAGVVYAVVSVTNEMLEMPQGPPGVAGTLADLLVFDPAGMVLFSFDAPARFFAEKLEAADWSPQASITLPGARVLNSSQEMSYKLPLPGTRLVRVLLMIGQGAGTGVQLRFRDGYHAGGVLGFQTDRRFVDAATGRESIQVGWGGGLFLDRNNSLLASTVLSRRAYDALQVNVYPGVLPGPLRPAGVWTSRSSHGAWSLGVAFRRTLGLGMGVEFAR